MRSLFVSTQKRAPSFHVLGLKESSVRLFFDFTCKITWKNFKSHFFVYYQNLAFHMIEQNKTSFPAVYVEAKFGNFQISP